MALAVRRDPGMGVADYQFWVADRPDEERRELIDGEPVLAPPPSERHQLIVLDLLRQLAPLARANNGRAIPGIAVLSEAMDGFAPMPDVMVRCGPMLKDGYARDPILVAEVVSPSTRHRDRGPKAEFYRTIASLGVFLLVDQETWHVEAWQRGTDGAWIERIRGRDARIGLPELGGRLAVADIYDDIDF